MLRRLLFCPALLAGLAPATPAAYPQAAPAPRILERRVRLTLDDTGEYRAIEALRVAIGTAEGSVWREPVPLLVLQEQAAGAQGLGGDVSPRQVVRDGERLAVVGMLPGPVFEVAATYRLPREATALVLQAVVPVDELVIYVDRGRIGLRPDAALATVADAGAPARPSRQFVASALPAGRRVLLGLRGGRTGWRQRLAVLVASSMLAGLAGVWAWRGGRGRA